jgi:hypothetical protein
MSSTPSPRKRKRPSRAKSEAETAANTAARVAAQLTYTDEMADEICRWIGAGQTRAEFCRQPGKPGRATVHEWRHRLPDFDKAYLDARDRGFDAIAEECLEIADDASRDAKIIRRGEHESTVCDTEFVQRSKLRIETRLKLLAKWDPRRYGEAMQLKHANQDGSGPATFRWATEPDDKVLNDPSAAHKQADQDDDDD